jgi:hypothetical protein
MADNIKIVGEILNTQQIARYNEEDVRLFIPQTLQENFGLQNDYIEYFVYDAGGNLLNTNYNYKSFKSPQTSFVESVGSLPIIEIDPVKDLQTLGYSSGEFKVQYNLFNNKLSSPKAELFLKEISADKTELRVGSTVLTNSEIETGSLALINEYTGSSYFVDYLVNFGNNVQVTAVNVALNKIESGYEVLFKLYQPLPDNIQEKVSLWVVKEKVNPYVFDINLDKLIIQAPGPQLRGPNFSIDIPDQNNIATSYQTYGGLVNSFSNVSSSYQQLLSLITSQSIDINTDYSNFTNFVNFSSAKQRIVNFYGKIKQIEDYNTNIAKYTVSSSFYPNMINDSKTAKANVNNIIANFDGFEYYLYFESGSTITSSYDYGIVPFPKSGSLKPYALFSTSSVSASIWFSAATSSADKYDDYNPNNLIYTTPAFIKDDENNDQYMTFLNMVGHYFDNIWIFLQAVTDVNLANNNLDQGISKDLVYFVLQSLGTKLYNKYGDADNISFLIGNSGSINFDNNFTLTGSYLNTIPRKDLLAESYKRIYHNLPLLLKQKGTVAGLKTLISTFGILNQSYYTIGSQSFYTPTGSALTSSILNIKEYGGDSKYNMLDEYNSTKIRIVSSSIVTGNVLSPYVSLQVQTTTSSLFRTNDLHYVDISFSPETQIDTYASASIALTNPSWSLDNYIGDPRQLYSGSYSDLVAQKNTYYNFTASNMDYAGFIRLIQYFDNSLFKMLKDYVPARANLSTGITISSPVLERNKWSYANPSTSTKLSASEGTIDGPSISTEYTNIYTGLTGSRAAYYTGVFTGSLLNVYKYFVSGNFNPYLHPTTSLTSNDINFFNHSNYNVLLNNITGSRLSLTRRDIEYIYGTTSSITTPAYLQDTNESLATYNRARYDGVKVSSLYYNTYTDASSTYGGDISYGKTAAIDRNSIKLGLFTEISESKFLPRRNNARLKYLVDINGDFTELNLRNKNWPEVQNIFVANDTGSISLFNNQLYSNQKTTDGEKTIFDSGYTYNPILYFAGTGSDKKLYFQSAGVTNAYRAQAKNTLAPYSVSGSTPNLYPLSGGFVPNIFDDLINDEASTYFSTGSGKYFPSYSAVNTGDYSVNVSLPFSIETNTSNSTWILQVWVSGSTRNAILSEDSHDFNGTPPTPTYSLTQKGTKKCTASGGCSTGENISIYLNSSDYALFVANGRLFGGIGGGGANTCTVIARDSSGTPLTGYVLVDISGGTGTCWKLTSGAFTINPTQC